MISAAQKLSAAAEASGLRFDETNSVLHGLFDGYSFAVTQSTSNTRFYSIFFHVAREGNAFSNDDGKQIAKASNKLVQFVKPMGVAICSFLIKIEKDEQAAAQKILEALTYLSGAFAARGYVNTCEHCRQQVGTDACVVGNGIRFLCPDCFETVSAELTDKAHVEAETPENVLGGIVGALGGALLGGVVVVLFGRLGYVTAVSGLIAAICALKGYELLAKKMSVKGAIISCVAMLAMIYVGHRADWAIEAAKYFEVDFFTAFRAIPMLIKEGAIEMGQYLKGLLLVYVFALIGAAPTVFNFIRGNKSKYTVQKLN